MLCQNGNPCFLWNGNKSSSPFFSRGFIFFYLDDIIPTLLTISSMKAPNFHFGDVRKRYSNPIFKQAQCGLLNNKVCRNKCLFSFLLGLQAAQNQIYASTLTIIRCVCTTGIQFAPEIYFFSNLYFPNCNFIQIYNLPFSSKTTHNLLMI